MPPSPITEILPVDMALSFDSRIIHLAVRLRAAGEASFATWRCFDLAGQADGTFDAGTSETAASVVSRRNVKVS